MTTERFSVPVILRDNTMLDFLEKRDWIAVLGGATRFDKRQVIAAFEAGRQIARHGKHVLTGGTTGVPYAAAIGAKREGAMVVGISPADSETEHLRRFRKPVDFVDLMVYTGLNDDGRSPLIIRSSSAAIFIGGDFGTLNEFTSAWMNGDNVLGILEGFGGISDSMRSLLEETETNGGGTAMFQSDPTRLVENVCAEVDRRNATRSNDTHNSIGADVHTIIEEHFESCVPQ